MNPANYQQARCPLHDVALTGPFASCPIDSCGWQIQRDAALQNARPSRAEMAALQNVQNDYFNLQIEANERALNPPEAKVLRALPPLTRWQRFKWWLRSRGIL